MRAHEAEEQIHQGEPAVESRLVPDLPPDAAIAERVLAAYRRTTTDFPNPGVAAVAGPHLWDHITKHVQKDFLAVLERGHVPEVDGYLRGLFRRNATHGTCQGRLEYETHQGDPAALRRAMIRTKDRLVALAEAIGARAIENPEQGPWGKAIRENAADLVRDISAELAIPLAPPPVDGGLYKLVAGDTLLHERDLYSVCTAWGIGQLVGRGARICEIGGGVGKGAYWSTLLRRTSSSDEAVSVPGPGYTILDLPHICVIQAAYLLRAGVRCSLYGEPLEGAEVAIRPHLDKANATGPFDLVLNQDSLPELALDDALDYLRWMRASTTATWFYSVNHESRPPAASGAQLSVLDLVRMVPGFIRSSRAHYWLRRGYVTEVYRILR